MALLSVSQIDWSPFHYRVMDTMFYDGLRTFTVFAAGFVVASTIRYFRETREHRDSAHTLVVWSNFVVALVFMLIEAEQIGRPLLVWRLPAIDVALALMIMSIRKMRSQREKERT